jgi:hypothetical protein
MVSGQSFLVRFPALPDFLSSGSGTGSTQPRETIEELLGRNSKSSGLESWEYGCRNPLHWPRDTLYLQTLALTSPTSGGRSVGIVRSQTNATALCIKNTGRREQKWEDSYLSPECWSVVSKLPADFDGFEGILYSLNVT